jgi:hypothetical protein
MYLLYVDLYFFGYMLKSGVSVNSLYSYPYLNQQKPLFLSIIAYTLSTTKLEIRAKWFLLGIEGVEG